MIDSLAFARNGDKQHSAFFEDYLRRLLEERDRIGLTAMVRGVEAMMITVDPRHPVEYIYWGGSDIRGQNAAINITKSVHSSLIIEYVQRFGDLDGFFARDNVAGLTPAAGAEEEQREMQALAASVTPTTHTIH